jgi:hypothetical protein
VYFKKQALIILEKFIHHQVKMAAMYINLGTMDSRLRQHLVEDEVWGWW